MFTQLLTVVCFLDVCTALVETGEVGLFVVTKKGYGI